VEFGLALVCHNLYLLIIPVLFWIEMTIVLKRTEEKWLTELYGQEYIEYCKKVNRCIPFFPK
jgi:protein-S-isoprenylcysteine O-methyltransferase Ste14